ncbi:type I-E CRISPR-associated protein Cas7/Cse4/CasC [Lysinibacter sp. HNR]|uniref:type I-E CRISPR-associated protein Cas7/Cse4/CasC n=1 Tax=Lysinibacter sp. HNR TaxID=3031408 RepID=UPI0024357BB2|nr:type I-E CRISPR-associated protein Cas7/Cse4/CasC [Lysinibacter sp. HNR]WGD37190.1 type I-E CRISPR-associated protein Cas7/Cse4/CasC [Lysinibacter sp. HNR]
MNNVYIDIHTIHTVPPSNMNRDDTGNPKEAVYGGVNRARVSSQSKKRATRTYFAEGRVDTEKDATRTRRLPKVVQERLVSLLEMEPEASKKLADLIINTLKNQKAKPLKRDPKDNDQLTYAFFYGQSQIDSWINNHKDSLLDYAKNGNLEGDKGQAEFDKQFRFEDAFTTGHPAHVALFGRMIADIPNLNVDAAVQVAHSLSTHAVQNQFDYFTAVDDQNTNEETGSSMIGSVAFNSATLYNFASISLQDLRENLDGDLNATKSSILKFIESFAKSMPSGHRNSFAHSTRPSLVTVIIRSDQPVNFVNAFEEPVPTQTKEGMESISIQKLAQEINQESNRWGDKPIATISTYKEHDAHAFELTEAFGESLTFPKFLEEIDNTLDAQLGGH